MTHKIRRLNTRTGTRQKQMVTGDWKEIQKKLEAEDRLKEAEQKARMDEMRERGPVITEVHHDEEK